MSKDFRITYWGVTGSVPAPADPEGIRDKLITAVVQMLQSDAFGKLCQDQHARPEQLRRFVEEHLPFHLQSTWGGNTTCIEVQTPDCVIVIDAGTGLFQLGSELAKRWADPGYSGPRVGHLLLTHGHMDHIYAIPFVEVFYQTGQFSLWAPQPVVEAIDAIWGQPNLLRVLFSPHGFETMPALKELRAIQPGQSLQLGQTEVATLELNHPGGCVAYRLTREGKSIVVATDHECPEVPDRRLAQFAHNADVFYCDAQYTEAEYDGKRGIGGSKPVCRHNCGHSTIEAAVCTAVAAGVKCLHLGHRDPHRTNGELAELERYATELMRRKLAEAGKDPAACKVLMPYEGLSIEL